MTAVRGRTVISERALTRTFGAIAAAELGVVASAPTVRVDDAAGRLAVRIVSPIALPSDEAGAPTRTVLDAAAATRARVLDEGAALTGALLAPVRVRLSSASFPERRRAR